MASSTTDCVVGLPQGWKREQSTRKNGVTAGMIDVYYFSPSGRKFRSKPEMASYLSSTVDLKHFDYRTGKFNTPRNLASPKKNPSSRKRRMKTPQFKYCCAMCNDGPLPPTPRIRRRSVPLSENIETTHNLPKSNGFKEGPESSTSEQDVVSQSCWSASNETNEAECADPKPFEYSPVSPENSSSSTATEVIDVNEQLQSRVSSLLEVSQTAQSPTGQYETVSEVMESSSRQFVASQAFESMLCKVVVEQTSKLHQAIIEQNSILKNVADSVAQLVSVLQSDEHPVAIHPKDSV